MNFLERREQENERAVHVVKTRNVAETTDMPTEERRTYTTVEPSPGTSDPDVYNVGNTADIGKPVKRVIDASGKEHFHCLEVNTKTGRIVKLQLTEDRFEEWQGELLKVAVYAPTPISIHF